MLEIVEFDIRSYRSITNFKLPFTSNDLNILCGANNVGKTNVLRAIFLLFNPYLSEFDGKNDVPYHVAEVVRGDAYKVEVSGIFQDDVYKYRVTVRFFPENINSDEHVEIIGEKYNKSGKKNKISITEEESLSLLNNFRVIFIGANNIDLPGIISDIFASEVLTDLDKLRKKQWTSLEDLNRFQESSHLAMKSIEDNLTKHIQSFSNVEGVGVSNWKASIRFPEFNKLRDAISKLVDFTIYDTNDLTLDFKGSGVQKIVLLAIMKHMAQEKNKNIIWLLDEPEAFLQPALQKTVFSELNSIAKEINIIITTHSQYFVNPSNLSSTHLLVASQEEREYRRKPGRAFILNSTEIDESTGNGKIEKIKSHLGINNNDAWTVSPNNIIVEGNDDKQHIKTMLEKLSLDVPNILVCGGADKLKGYLHFLSEFSGELSFKPKFVCILDHDDKGKKVYSSIDAREFDQIEVQCMFVNRSNSTAVTDKHDYEFEDMIPHELILAAANKILKQKRYKTLQMNSLNSRYSLAYDKSCVLARIDELVKSRNSDKSPLNFNSNTFKIYLNMKIDEAINSMSQEEFSNLVGQSEGLADFLNTVSDLAK